PPADPREFSIILGGPLYQLLRRAHVAGDALELARRRILVIALFAWLPLLVLALAGGEAFGGAAAIPFVKDVEVHLRFLVAMPLLVAAELLVHVRLRPVAGEFLARGLVPDESIERFRASLRSAFRLRNSVTAEVAMIALIYFVGVRYVWGHYAALDIVTWYAVPSAEGPRLTLAGYWYAYVSVPLFQFLLLRWYFRIFIWMRFLWQVSRIPLNLSAMHGDQFAGLGFLAGTVYAFMPLLMAHGALLSGNIANRILYMGGTLAGSQAEIGVVLVYLLLLVLAPLTVFAPQINAAKRKALREYSRLAQRYVRDFEAKWVPGGVPARESPLGSGDIQSLADMSNGLATVRATRAVPVTRDAILALVVATLAPLAPLLLTVIPAAELAKRLLKLLL
ncbi:MAG: hypothetical protein ACXWAU_07990, partial [Usitatibacter sp.]